MKKEFISESVNDMQNAGLVILHPFLLPLFENLNWCKGTVWADDKCWHKAVLATQYLVTGKQEYDSEVLSLNKLLCGFPIDQPINTTILLTATEMNECRNLLAAVLSHWKALKGSSIEALQLHFLQRDGKWAEANGKIELWLEKRAADILLESLPWNVWIVKTPWMPELLNCYW